MPVATTKERSVYGDQERDIMQLTETLRDAFAVQEIVRGLRGRDRRQIEGFLARLVNEKGNEERDIMQGIEKSAELDPDLYRALDHLLGNGSSYLGSLRRLARRRYDWRRLPIPSRI